MAVDIKISDNNLLPWSNMEDWENGTSAAPTEHTLSGSGATIARESTIIKQGTYSARVTRVGNDTTLYYDYPDYADYAGKRVTFACWVYATVASRGRIAISDGVGSSTSSYHTGVAGWERLTVTRNLDASNTRLRVEMQVNTGNTSVYFDGGLLVEGDNDIYIFTNNVDINDWKPTNVYRSQKFTVARREGALIPNVTLDERSIRISGKVIGTSSSTARDTWDTLLENINSNIVNPLGETQLKNLYLFDDRYLVGVIQRIDPKFIAALSAMEFNIDFTCGNPFYKYVQMKRTADTMASSPNIFTVTTSGNAFTRPIIKVTAGSSNITTLIVTNLTTDQSWSYSGTILSGESLILDTDLLTLENDGANAFSSFSGEPQMILLPGDNLFSVTFTGGSTNSVIRVDYFDRWY